MKLFCLLNPFDRIHHVGDYECEFIVRLAPPRTNVTRSTAPHGTRAIGYTGSVIIRHKMSGEVMETYVDEMYGPNEDAIDVEKLFDRMMLKVMEHYGHQGY